MAMSLTASASRPQFLAAAAIRARMAASLCASSSCVEWTCSIGNAQKAVRYENIITQKAKGHSSGTEIDAMVVLFGPQPPHKPVFLRRNVDEISDI
jgi:hypothetical protein